MRAIARAGRDGASLSRLAASTGLPRPTIHRVLNTLIGSGFVERDPDSRNFFLGREILCLGYAALLRHPIERVAATELARLARETGQTIYLHMRAGDDTICIARHESATPIQTLVQQVGARQPLGFGAGGMAILATLPPEEAEEIIRINQPRYLERDTFDERVFRDALKAARTSGFATHDGLFTPGVSGIGVAVRDQAGHALAGVSTAFVSDWLDADRRLRCAARIGETAAAIALQLLRPHESCITGEAP